MNFFHLDCLASEVRLNVDQTIRGVKGESNDVPLTASMVVMLAAIPPAVPGNEICADPDTTEAHVPVLLIETAVLPLPGMFRVVEPHIAPDGPYSVSFALVRSFMLLRTSTNAWLLPPANHHGENSVVSIINTCMV